MRSACSWVLRFMLGVCATLLWVPEPVHAVIKGYSLSTCDAPVEELRGKVVAQGQMDEALCGSEEAPSHLGGVACQKVAPKGCREFRFRCITQFSCLTRGETKAPKGIDSDVPAVPGADVGTVGSSENDSGISAAPSPLPSLAGGKTGLAGKANSSTGKPEIKSQKSTVSAALVKETQASAAVLAQSSLSPSGGEGEVTEDSPLTKSESEAAPDSVHTKTIIRSLPLPQSLEVEKADGLEDSEWTKSMQPPAAKEKPELSRLGVLAAESVKSDTSPAVPSAEGVRQGGEEPVLRGEVPSAPLPLGSQSPVSAPATPLGASANGPRARPTQVSQIRDLATPPSPAVSSQLVEQLFTFGPLLPVVFALGVLLMMVASLWRVFEKAGISGFSSIVPFYNAWQWHRIAGQPGWFMIVDLIPMIGVVSYFSANLGISRRFGFGIPMCLLLTFAPFIGYPYLAFSLKTQYTPA